MNEVSEACTSETKDAGGDLFDGLLGVLVDELPLNNSKHQLLGEGPCLMHEAYTEVPTASVPLSSSP